MTVYMDLSVSCDVDGCDNESSVEGFEAPFLPAEEIEEYMRMRAAETPKAWRVIDGKDICYRHRKEFG